MYCFPGLKIFDCGSKVMIEEEGWKKIMFSVYKQVTGLGWRGKKGIGW